MEDPEENRLMISLDAGQLKRKLLLIIMSLQEQTKSIKQFYCCKISQLYDEVAEKDNKIHSLEAKLREKEGKISQLESLLRKKEVWIRRLSSKLCKIEDKFHDKVSSCLKKISTELEDYIVRAPSSPHHCEKYDRYSEIIGSEENFTKTANMFDNFRKGQENTENTTFATVLAEHSISTTKRAYPEPVSRPKLTKIRSLEKIGFNSMKNIFSNPTVMNDQSQKTTHWRQKIPSSVLIQQITPSNALTQPKIQIHNHYPSTQILPNQAYLPFETDKVLRRK